MAIARVQRLYLVAHSSCRDAVTQALQRLEAVHVTDITDSDYLEHGEMPDLMRYDQRISELDWASKFLADFEAKPNFLEGFFSPKITVDEKRFERAAGFNYRKLHDACKEIDGRLRDLKTREAKLEETYEQVSRWKSLDVPLEEIRETDRTSAELGTIADFAGLKDELDGLAYVENVYEDKKRQHVFLLYLIEDKETVRKILEEHEFSPVTFPEGLKGTPEGVMARVADELSEIGVKREQLTESAKDLVDQRTDLLTAYDQLSTQKDRDSLPKYLGNTRETFVLEGWIKRENVEKLTKKMRSISDAIHVVVRDPADDEQVPILMENKRMVRPFELLTRMYGTAKYSEVDPTPIIAPFFVLFFGLCLSDVCYGISLIIGSFIFLKKIKMGPDGQRLFKLLIPCGVSAVVFGALTGGWFGDLFDYMPVVFQNFRDIFIVFRPMDDIPKLMVLSLVIGIIQICFGFLVMMYRNLRDGYIVDAIFDQGLWLLLIISGVLLAVTFFGVETPLGPMVQYLFVAALIGLVATQGRKQKSIPKKMLSGFASLYGIIGLLSDGLSYLRLFALGIGTYILAMVFNTLASLAGDIPYVGIVFMVVILIIAHIFILFMNGLSAFVHSLRLQYVEFFPKFFEGGGMPFKPFGMDTKYVNVQEVV